jgi:hypothetical protein
VAFVLNTIVFAVAADIPVSRSPVNAIPGNAAVPAAAASAPVMVPPAKLSSPRFALPNVPIVIHALLALFRCFNSPLIVSGHHWYAYIVAGSVAPLLLLTVAPNAPFKSLRTAAPVPLEIM